MFPFFNSPQLLPSNPSLQNTMQNQPHMGLINPQIPMPFNNSNVPMNNGPSMALPGVQRPINFMPFQNNHLGMPQFPHPGQPQLGFAPQNVNLAQGDLCNLAQNMNPVSICQQNGFPQGFPNMHQLNQNMGLPNGQLLMQNMSQAMPMQMPGPAQVAPFVGPPGSNQLVQGMGPRMPNFTGNPPFGMLQHNRVNQNQQNLVMPAADALKQSPLGNNQAQQNWSGHPNSCSFVAQQTPNLQSPQGNTVKTREITNTKSNWKKFPDKNFNRNLNGEASHRGFRKHQFHHVKNGKRKFDSTENNQKGNRTEKAGKFGLANATNQTRERKRSLAHTYTEQEIRQWREERKRNYPSKANIEKKLSGKPTDNEAKLRREQLKAILAKQAELGFEVAEVPEHYLLDSEKNVQGMKEAARPSAKNVKFQNRHDKRGRNGRKDRYGKKQRLDSKNNYTAPSMNKRKPTLLQKLLSADIMRDRSHLLQVFRFMVMNSFFKDWPERPLEFPEVIVKENGFGDNNEKSTVAAYSSEGNINILAQNSGEIGYSSSEDEEEDYDSNDINARDEAHGSTQKKTRLERLKPGQEIMKLEEEEEGEIID